MRYLYRRASVALALLLLALPAWAADIVIDPGCTVNGNGTGAGYTATCDATAADNPTNVVPAFVDGNTYLFRGVHASHGSCTSGFDGRYNQDRILLNGLDNATLKVYDWTTPGTGEKVYLDATVAPSGGWTVCTWDSGASQCDCGPGNQNLTTLGDGGQTACVETWWATDTVTADLVPGAQKKDGSGTYRVTSLGAMDNSTAGYISARCTNSADSTQTFIPCLSDQGCPSGETCSATSAEVDSFRDATPTPDELMVRWGAAGDSDCSDQRCNPTTAGFKSYVVTSDNSYGFQVQTAATNLNIQGFWCRVGRRSCVSLDDTTDGDTHDIVIDDLHSMWRGDTTGSGGDYGFQGHGVKNITLQNSEAAWNGSEIHIEGALADAVTVWTIKNNWIHDIGNQNALGPGTSGTAHAFILGEQGGGPGTGNYTGSIFENNLIQRMTNPGLSAGIGIILENDSDGWIIRNNVFSVLDGPCIKMDAKGSVGTASTSSHQIYNNIFHDCGNSPGGNPGVCMYWFANNAGGSNAVSSNSVYNNTFVNCQAGSLDIDITAGAACASNLVRNNIMYSSEGQKQVDETACDTSSNILDFNLISTSANPAATWQESGVSTNEACAALTDIGAGNINNCPDPSFVSSSNFHIQSGSPAKDTGTTRCCSSTTDINNTIADDHGFVSYADNQAPSGTVDIGADEFIASGKRRILVTVSP